MDIHIPIEWFVRHPFVSGVIAGATPVGVVLGFFTYQFGKALSGLWRR